ncbi:unnamed protein product [Schistocephalus solidus]|uniref:Reverse transcriptase domain-containing protein n=1 Tax=Schistocephalus solidus TaxID=70667 RepID=A0A183T065_SCHSO|nr:unnamed protein product [Schistocephalus solidus]
MKGTAPLLSSDSTTLLTEKSQILKRWVEHFRTVLNCSSDIDRLPQVDTNNDLDLPPSLRETILTVQQIFSGKTPGSDAIPPEVYKQGGTLLMAELTTLFQEMWRQGQVPQDFKDAIIVQLYKRKGNRQLWDNHRGISLLNITGKIFAHILLNRLNGQLEQGLLPESQFNDLLFADDCTVNNVTEEDMQRSMDLFAADCAHFGLTISTAKTVVMHQPPPSAEYDAPKINVIGVVVRPGAAPAFTALPLREIRARCGGTPMGGSGRAIHMRSLPSPVFLTMS